MPAWWDEPTAKHAYVLSWISVIVTFFAAVFGIVYYIAKGSALILSWGVENCVDLLSSAVVLWRFYCPHELDEETEQLLMKREKRASIAISIILGLLGIGIMGAAIDDFVHGPEDTQKYDLVLVVSFVSLIVFGSMTILKFRYSAKLNSASLRKDGICSLIGTVLAGALFSNTLIISAFNKLWWLDPSVALGCGISCIVIGVYSVYLAAFVQNIPIFTLAWWFLSQGNGTDEVTGRNLGPEDLKQDRQFGQQEQDTEMSATPTPTHTTAPPQISGNTNDETVVNEVL